MLHQSCYENLYRKVIQKYHYCPRLLQVGIHSMSLLLVVQYQ